MSPEQAEGRKVDGRSDIFSFGALLYEMVTGRKAFQRNSKLSTLSAILRDEPKPASEVVEGLPRELERIIARCLRKSPERRFQAMPDLKVALEELKEEADSGTLSAEPARQRRSEPRLALAAVVLVIFALGGATPWFVSHGTTPQAALSAIPLTTYPGFQYEPSFSPDGNQVTFSWNDHIYIKLIGTTGPPLQLTTDAARDHSPAWSPDGRFIAFLRDQPGGNAEVRLVQALGGQERKVSEVSRSTPSDPLPGPYLTWSPDGNSLVISDKDSSGKQPFALFLLSIETGEKRRLTSPPAGLQGDSGPAFAPNGRSLAFTRTVDTGVSDLYLLPISSGSKSLREPSQLTFGNRNTAGAVWKSDGREIIFGNWSYASGRFYHAGPMESCGSYAYRAGRGATKAGRSRRK